MFFLNFSDSKQISKLCALALFLAGCNGDGQSGSNLPSRQLKASDGFAVVTPDKPSMVNVAPHVSGASGGDILTSVESIDGDPNCNGFSTVAHDLTFTVDAPSGVWCDYQYTVTPSSGAQLVTAKMSVFSSNSPVTAVKSLSHPMTRSKTDTKNDVNFVLDSLLGVDWPGGYKLATTGAKSPKVKSGMSNKGSISASGNQITFTEPDAPGWYLITYTLEADSGGDKVGVIYITVSDPANKPPDIKKTKYNFNTENPQKTVKIHESLDIDLSGFITDPEQQDWQLINTQAFSGLVAPKDQLDPSNKIITYTPYLVGKQSIAYTVADHYGGYSSGLIEVTAGSKEKAVTWTDLDSFGNTFIKPKRYSDGLVGGYAVSAVWESSLQNTISAYTSDVAEIYCRSVGYIPTKAQMDLLRSEHYTTRANTGALNKWPALYKYIVREIHTASYKSYDLKTGIQSDYDAAAPNYVTCIKNPSLNLTLLMHEVVADGTQVKVGEVLKPTSMNVTLGKASGNLDKGDVNLTVTDSATSQDIKEIKSSSIKAGTYRFNVTNNDDASEVLVSPLIKYIGDIRTAVLFNTVVRATAVSNNVAEAEAIYHLKDANSNPLANHSLDITITGKDLQGVSFTEPVVKTLTGRTDTVTGVTDDSGILTVKLKSNSVLSNLIVKAKLKSDSSKSNDSFEPKFDNFAGNVIDILKVDSGKLFISSPSKTFIDGLRGIATNWVYKENVGDFYLFDSDNAYKLCESYNTHRVGGKNNWRLPTADELKTELLKPNHKLYFKHGWPISKRSYWSVTGLVSLWNGNFYPRIKNSVDYVSCVSDAKVYAGLDIFKHTKSSTFTQTGVAFHKGTLSYSSDNSNVATVDSSTGKVEVKGKVGTAIITVTEAAGDGYPEQSDSYTLTVSTLAGNVISTISKKDGNKLLLFTNSPSKAFIDGLGGIATDGKQTENGGDFYTFSQTNASALCEAYNIHRVGGKNNWYFPSFSVLNSLSKMSAQYKELHWPNSIQYSSSSKNEALDIIAVKHKYTKDQDTSYVTCVSESNI